MPIALQKKPWVVLIQGWKSVIAIIGHLLEIGLPGQN
jgi:hypothetical protein